VINTLRANIHGHDIGALMEQRTEQCRNDLAAELEAFWGRFPQLKEAMKDRKVLLTILEGYPSSVICHFASTGKFDMIVMAANKKSYLATYACRVTKGVIKRTKVPVVVPAVR